MATKTAKPPEAMSEDTKPLSPSEQLARAEENRPDIPPLEAIVERRALAEAISTAIRAVPSRSALPIQSHFLLETGDKCIKVTGADYELQIERTVPAQVLKRGKAAILAKTLADLVNTFPDTDIHLASEGDKLLMTCGLSEYEVLGLPSDEFPPVPEIEIDKVLRIPAAALKSMVRQTAFAASDDPSRPQLTGLNLMAQGNEIKLCGAEMSRLCLRTHQLEVPFADPVDCIIPAKTLVEVSKFAGSVEDEVLVEIGVTQNQVCFTIPGIKVVSRLIDGKFPNFEKVVPKQWSRKATVSTSSLELSCRRALSVAGDSKRLLFRFSKETVEILAESGGTGRGKEVVSIVLEGDEGIEIAFDGKLLREFLSLVDAESIAMEMSAPLSPGVIRPIDGEDLCYVQMPMHLM